MSTSHSWEGKDRYGSFRLRMNVWVCTVQVKLWNPLRTRAIPGRTSSPLNALKSDKIRLQTGNSPKPRQVDVEVKYETGDESLYTSLASESQFLEDASRRGSVCCSVEKDGEDCVTHQSSMTSVVRIDQTRFSDC